MLIYVISRRKDSNWVDSEKDCRNEKVVDIEEQPPKNDDSQGEELLLPETDGLWYMGQSKKHR